MSPSRPFWNRSSLDAMETEPPRPAFWASIGRRYGKSCGTMGWMTLETEIFEGIWFWVVVRFKINPRRDGAL